MLTNITGLHEINEEVAKTLLPVIIIVGILCFIGILGNPLVIYFYGFKLKPTPSYIFIVALAVSDLTVCSVSMPLEIVDLLQFYTFESREACKILRFVNYLASITSAFFLLTIAVDRYRKICKPFKRQITNSIAAFLVFIDCVFGFALAWPNILFYTSAEVNVTEANDIIGYDCTTVPGNTFKFYILLYNIVLLMAFFLTITSLSVLYGLVAKQLFNLRRVRFQSSKPVPSVSRALKTETSIISVDAKSTEYVVNVIPGVSNTDAKTLSTIQEDDFSKESIKKGITLSKTCPTPSNSDNHSSGLINLKTDSSKVFPEISLRNQQLLSLSKTSGEVSQSDEEIYNDSQQSTSNQTNIATMFQINDKDRENVANIGQQKSGIKYALTPVLTVSSSSAISHKGENVSDNQQRDAHAFKSKSLDQKQGHAQNIDTRRYTVIMMSITAAFVLGFLPYLIVFTWSRLTPNYEPSLLNKSELISVQLFVRSWLLNGAVNPLIYGFLNSEFRQFMKSIIRNITSLCGKEENRFQVQSNALKKSSLNQT